MLIVIPAQIWLHETSKTRTRPVNQEDPDCRSSGVWASAQDSSTSFHRIDAMSLESLKGFWLFLRRGTRRKAQHFTLGRLQGWVDFWYGISQKERGPYKED